MFRKVGLFLILLFFTTQPALASGVEYNLAYPGMLPDSPFYILKVARDNIMETLIRGDEQKAFYLLLLSDKRLASAQLLLNKGKKGLAVVVVVKSQEYYGRAVDLAVKKNKQSFSSNNADLLSKLAVAGSKHEEIIMGFGNDLDVNKALIAAQKDKNRVLKNLINK